MEGTIDQMMISNARNLDDHVWCLNALELLVMFLREHGVSIYEGCAKRFVDVLSDEGKQMFTGPHGELP